MTPVSSYLAQTYWWAYVHPNAVRLFERLRKLDLWRHELVTITVPQGHAQ